MSQPEFSPFVELLDQIAGFCAQGHTGTVMLVSDDNRMAQIHLQGGRIIFILCRGRRGRDGLGIMRTMQNARMTMDRASAINNDPLEWSTEVVLDYLYGNISDLPAGNPATAAAPLSSAPRAPAPAPVRSNPASAGGTALTPEHRSTFERSLAKYIGPMASIVCGDYFDDATDLRELALKLAGEIPGAEQAAKFKVDVAKAFDLDPL